jgi:hypothetical protein
MNDNVDRRIATWLAEQFVEHRPDELLDRVLQTTSRRRPRPARLGRLGGHHLSPTTSAPGVARQWKERPVNRALGLVAAVATIAIVAVIGYAIFAPPGSGPGGAPTPSPTPTAIASPSRIGPLAPGAYHSVTFKPELRFEVPAGWSNTADDRDGYALERSGTAVRVTGGRVLGNNANDCEGLFDQNAPTSVDGTVAALATDPRFTLDTHQPITVGALSGQLLDIHLAATWTGTCNFSAGKPAAILLTAANPPGPVISLVGDERMRLILLDSAEGLISIGVEPSLTPEAQALIDTFEFTR